jgi:hypothetical protein
MKPDRAAFEPTALVRRLFPTLLLLAAFTTRGAGPLPGIAPVISVNGGFAIDGDLFANTPRTNVGDWMISPSNPGSGGALLDAAGVPLDPIQTFHYVDPYNGNDPVFSGGSKWTDNPNSWKWATSKASAKTDINNVLLHLTEDTNGHTWLLIAGDRRSAGGDSYIDFEFLQNTLTKNANGTFSSQGPDDGRTAKDFLLSLAFGGGGQLAGVFAWQWQGNTSGGFQYVDITATLPPTHVFTALNSNTIPVPFGAFGQTAYEPFVFAEAAVDVTALLGSWDPCLSFGFNTIMVKTKASQSATASIEDFVDPIQFRKVGPSADAGADQARCTAGGVVDFSLVGTATPGNAPIVSTTWSVVSGSAVIDDTNSLSTTAHVSSAEARLRLSVVQSNGCSGADEIVLTVKPLPDCSITGPSVVCTRATASLQGPAGMDSYSWSVTGNGAISGPTSQQAVTVIAGSACSSNVIVSLVVTKNGCSKACSQAVLVNDTTAPTITCPTNVTVAENPRDSGGAVVTFPAVVASDSCSAPVTISLSHTSGTVFPAGSTTVTATASDLCGNSNTCQFIVKVIPYQLKVNSLADAGPGTLRQALLDGNAFPDENLVRFELAGTGPFVIHLLSPLPTVTSPLIIDGSSQSDSNGLPLLELDGGGGTNAFDGLVIVSGNSTVRGLALHGFATALRLETNGNNVVQGNFIGTDVMGTNTAGNSGDGIYINSSRNLIGGTNDGAANLIVNNGGNGILVTALAGSQNAFLENSIYSNGRLGIDLGADGVTPNDIGDSDTGPNGLQNYPVLTDATSIDGITKIYGYLLSSPGPYRIDFFLNDNPDPSGSGEGQRYLGFLNLILGSTGSNAFVATFELQARATQFVTTIATDGTNNSSEFSAGVQVRTPPVIEVQPAGTNVASGNIATLCAVVSGTPPLKFQWRQNGVNIAGATNSCYTIPSAQLGQGGGYTVLAQNDLGAVSSVLADLTLSLARIPGGDHFTNRFTISGPSGILSANNLKATFEPGEPLHAGKPGGKSIWYSWTPTFTGVATIRTEGSTFDTLLAVYTGSTLTSLVKVDSDEDRGGFYTSKAFFNAFVGVEYDIAVDGFAGASGGFNLSWSEEDTPHLIPIFTVQPLSQTVAPGDNVTFTAVAVSVCGQGHVDCVNPGHYPEDDLPKLDYQWYFLGVPVPGATTNTLTVTNIQASNLGFYSLHVSTTWHTIESDDANLQINVTGGGTAAVLATDKLLDSETGILHVGVPSPTQQANKGGFTTTAASAVVRGYTGTQIFNTAGSATGPGELICGVIGGASEWVTFIAEVSGNLFLNTEGSSYDTVMAVFRRSPTNAAFLEMLACDNNGGADGKDSSLSLPVEMGKTNYVLVDGVGGATGILQLNYSLATDTVLKYLGVTPNGAQHLQVVGRTNLHFAIQCSPDMQNWTSLFTTNAVNGVFDFIDTGATGKPVRFYRALLLP